MVLVFGYTFGLNLLKNRGRYSGNDNLATLSYLNSKKGTKFTSFKQPSGGSWMVVGMGIIATLEQVDMETCQKEIVETVKPE
ncbi:hypothetical protein [Campylobacter porcelli]|uniref:hypothetical protein n=1 Tax=Campylobacter porcelli TaxID=1660073 RepID=UPI00112F9AC5|nr:MULTISPECIES: hypothetical protein [unclassified Campylobacter]